MRVRVLLLYTMESNDILNCSVNMEWLNSQGIVQRKLSYKTGSLKLIRNEFRQIYIEVSADKAVPVRLALKDVSVHNKFMREGKASIKFQNCTLFLSNAPPSSLLCFLRTVFVKMTGEKNVPTMSVPLRTQLLSKKPKQFEEISPVTVADLQQAHAKVSKSTETTPSPSRKRKLQSEGTKGNIVKKLYSASPIPSEPLNIEQQEVLDACLAGHNVFFTGSAGTGKSYLLKKIINALPPDATTAAASTGVAACHIGGVTLHQFAGIGFGDATLERCYDMASKAATAQIWRKCKHLIIDEISMIDGTYFEKIEAVARRIRRTDKPFGGIQLILCGDFFQLPPVTKTKYNAQNAGAKNNATFCFQTSAWKKCVHLMFELSQVHRQSDPKFIDILNNIRFGKVNDDIERVLLATSKQKIEQNGILATRLCSHTQDANLINESKLNGLPGENKVFEALDSEKHLSHQLDQQTPVPGKLVLKIGAQVMLLKNINIAEGLVNGARGVIIEFRDEIPIVRLRNKKEYVAKREKWIVKTASGALLVRKQVPLKLAWAFSIHKSQGLTLDCVEMSLSRVFEAGQAYVALSRAQSLEALRILDFKASQVWANPNVLIFYKEFQRQISETKLFPLGKKNVPSNVKAKMKSVIKDRFKDKPLVTIS